MENYWVSLFNFRAKQVAELEAENEWLRERSILHEEIVNEIKECLIEGRKDGRQLGEAEEELKSLKSDQNFSTDQNEQLGGKVIDQQQKISDHNDLATEDQSKQIEKLKSENEFLRNKCAGQELVIDGLVGECAKKEKQIGEAEEMNKRLKNELDLTALFDSSGTVPSSSSTPCTSTRLHSPIHGDVQTETEAAAFCCNRPSSTSSTLCSSAPKNGNDQIESEALCVNASVQPPLSNASSTTLCRPTLHANVQIKLERFSAPSYSPSVRFGCCDLFSLLKRMFCCSMGHDDRTAESSRSEL